MSKSIVSITTCDTYEEEKIYEAVKVAVESLGGLKAFIQPEEKVLIKPNFLYAADPEKCITTHPAVIKAVIRLLEENQYAHFICGDSPAHGSCKDVFSKLELDEKYMTPMNKEEQRDGLYFVEEALHCDAIIGLSKMKTHMLERVTGAVKNMYGLICGYRKAAGHVAYPNAASFAKMMTVIHRNTPQRLHIMDGVMAMEGNGPSSGTPVKMGVILASQDPIALDAVFCHLVYLDPTQVPTETYGYKEGLGTYKENEIELLLNGQPISMKELVEKYGNPKFDVKREIDRINVLSILSHITSAFSTRPVIDKEKCVKCGVCVSHCPVEGKAITFAKGKEVPPVYDYKKCIRCYCCQEVCPKHAIHVK